METTNMTGKWKQYIAAVGLFLLAAMMMAGCKTKKDPLAKIKDLEFTVVAEENIPEELLAAINEKKADGFKVTYQDNGYMYICRGYGEQETGGYSISVNALYETENAVYFDTTLQGPKPGENEGKKVSKSYPYVVIKTEMIEKPIVFD
ncbi:MAG: protease complex subunit PrcB family protein [Lachnospiraceae bacterium]|nr:protease complex subunit PrcB family protein [Lachnospiraceae bacterium]